MDKMTIIFLIFIAFSVLFFIIMMICGKHEKEKREANETIENIDKFETIEINVKVVDQCCTTRMVGVKYPKSIEEYFISFEKDNGEVLKLLVPKECYDGFEIGQVGVLTLVDGKIYSFKLD